MKREALHFKSGRKWSLLGFAVSVLTPALGEVHKYWGLVGIVLYLIIGSLVVALVIERLYLKINSMISEKQALVLAAATIAGIAAVFALVYPFANSGLVGGGSDAEDSLNIAVTALLHGQSPYRFSTYLGNPIGRLPGSILFAAPFVMLGNSAYQNLFWIAVFLVVMRLFLQDGRSALLLVWSLCGLSPLVIQQLVTGSDRLANSLFVLIFIILMTRFVTRAGSSTKSKAALAVLFGIALLSRANFVLLLPLVFSFLVQNAGWKPAAKYVGLALLALVVMTALAYYLDPDNFLTTVLAQAYKTQGGSPDLSVDWNWILPAASLIVSVLTGLAAFLLAFQPMGSSRYITLLRNCAIVQAMPVVTAVLLGLISSGRVNPYYIGYGMHFMFFGAVASWAGLVGSAAVSSADATLFRGRVGAQR